MSTNYYWQPNECHSCGRAEERVHITKSLTSWEGTFTEDEFGSIGAPTIASVQNWFAWLSAQGDSGYIVTEYNEKVSLDDFIRRVGYVPPEARRRQFDWATQNRDYAGQSRVSDVPADRKYWLDPEGFTFYGGEFS